MFIWVNGIKKMVKVSDKFPPLKIRQGINLDYDWIKIKNPEEAFRMLGGYVACDGNTMKQVDVLYELAQKLGNKSKTVPSQST